MMYRMRRNRVDCVTEKGIVPGPPGEDGRRGPECGDDSITSGGETIKVMLASAFSCDAMPTVGSSEKHQYPWREFAQPTTVKRALHEGEAHSRTPRPIAGTVPADLMPPGGLGLAHERAHELASQIEDTQGHSCIVRQLVGDR